MYCWKPNTQFPYPPPPRSLDVLFRKACERKGERKEFLCFSKSVWRLCFNKCVCLCRIICHLLNSGRCWETVINMALVAVLRKPVSITELESCSIAWWCLFMLNFSKFRELTKWLFSLGFQLFSIEFSLCTKSFSLKTVLCFFCFWLPWLWSFSLPWLWSFSAVLSYHHIMFPSLL